MFIINKDTIKVGGNTYTLIQHDTNYLNEEGVHGLCDCTKLEIHIVSGDLPRDVIRNTLIHEILHAIYREYDISDEDDEETTVTRLANGLCQVSLDNPWIAKI